MRTRPARSGSSSASERPESAASGLLREGLAEDGSVLQEATFLGGEPVEAGGDQALQRLRHLELRDLAGDAVDALLLHEQAAVEERADRLDRVQRNALGPGEDALAKLLRKPGHEPVEERPHRRLRKGCERERRLVGAVPEVGVPSLELRAREAQHEDRLLSRPLEQVPDELDERGVGPLQVLEEECDGPLLGHALEEEAPRAKELLLASRRPVLEPEQVQQAWFDEPALLVVREELLRGCSDLRRSGRRVLALRDAGAHSDHLGERPEGDAFPVGETAPAVPPDELLETVHVLEVLPAEPRLADAGDADDGHELRPALVGRGVEDLLHEPKLAVATDEGRLQAD